MNKYELAAGMPLLRAYTNRVGPNVLTAAEPGGQVHPPLTLREKECLRWTLEGKTAWEVGRILAKSERTIAGDLARATKKLGCVNKYQAAVKALRLGLIR